MLDRDILKHDLEAINALCDSIGARQDPGPRLLKDYYESFLGSAQERGIDTNDAGFKAGMAAAYTGFLDAVTSEVPSTKAYELMVMLAATMASESLDRLLATEG